MTKAKRKYNEEFKEEAINLLRSSNRSVADIAKELGISRSTLSRWDQQKAKEEGDVIKQGTNQLADPAADRPVKKEESSNQSPVELSIPAPTDSSGDKVGTEVATASKNRDEEWQQIAVFHVTYLKWRVKGKVAEQRTLIEYHETDKRHHWDHIETEGIGQWIVEQAGDELQPEAEEVLEEVRPEPEAAARLSVIVTGVHLNQPAGTEVPLTTGKTGRPQFGIVQASHPFNVETDIELGEEEVANGKREIPYRAQFYAHNRQTGETIHLGNSKLGLLVSGEIVSASLTQIALPPGRYCLQALVEAEREDVAPGFYEVPMLEAV